MSTTRGILAAFALLVATLTASAEDIGYDPRANAFELLETAQTNAAADDKLVLLISGGDWCIWCHYLYAFLEKNDDLDRALHDTFVVAKVYVGEENRNEQFFAKLPKADGAPHFWVLSAAGDVLKSQPTVVLEDGGKSYDREAFLGFINEWRQRRER